MVYVRATGPYETSIPQAWEKMFAWLDRAGLTSTNGRGHGLARDNPATTKAEECRYDACIEVKPYFEERALRELGLLMLPGGSYLRQRTAGDYSKMREIVPNLYRTFQAPAGLRFDDKRPLVMIYLDDPRRFDVEELRSDICIPVSAKSVKSRDEDGRAAA
jgi:AraC family transcriptional regulator